MNTYRFAGLILIAIASAGSAGAQAIQWEVVHRFRLASQPEQGKALYDQIRVAPDRASKGRSYLYPSPLKKVSTEYSELALPATAWDPSAQVYAANYAHPQTWEIKVGIPALRTRTCVWLVRSSGKQTQGDCVDTRLAVQLSDQVSATLVDGASARELSMPIEIQHKRVLVMGDSFASGEGVPEINREAVYEDGVFKEFVSMPYWWDQKCHRSLLSAGVQASLKWAMADPRRSVTTLSYACSGAEIGQIVDGASKNGGLLGHYDGRETSQQLKDRREGGTRQDRFNVNLHLSEVQPLPSQLNQAIRDLCPAAVDRSQPVWVCPQRLASPDLLVFSIGGNDVGFGEIIRKAVFGDCKAECVKRISEVGFSTLAARYDEMAALVNTHLAPGRVLMLDYGNPTQDETGAYCSRDGSPLHLTKAMFPGGLLRISREEYQAAHRLVVGPVNDAGDGLVERNRDKGWSRLRVMEKATAKKGICSKRSWFNSSWSAYFKQHNLPGEVYSSGTAHPNIIYQAYQADAIVDWMKRTGF